MILIWKKIVKHINLKQSKPKGFLWIRKKYTNRFNNFTENSAIEKPIKITVKNIFTY